MHLEWVNCLCSRPQVVQTQQHANDSWNKIDNSSVLPFPACHHRLPSSPSSVKKSKRTCHFMPGYILYVIIADGYLQAFTQYLLYISIIRNNILSKVCIQSIHSSTLCTILALTITLHRFASRMHANHVPSHHRKTLSRLSVTLIRTCHGACN